MLDNGFELGTSEHYQSILPFIKTKCCTWTTLLIYYSLDDLASYVSQKYLKACKTFDTSKNVKFLTWFERFMHNDLLVLNKKVKKNFVFSLDQLMKSEVSMSEVVAIDETQDLENNLVNEGKIVRLVRAIEDDKYSEVLKRYYFQDMTQREIGEHTGFAQSYVGRIVKRFEKNLREEVRQSA